MGILPSGSPAPENFPHRFGVVGGTADRLSLPNRTEGAVTSLLKSDVADDIAPFGNAIDNIFTGMLRAMNGDSVVNTALKGIGTLFGTVKSNISDLIDGQFALNGRLDLVESISGYVSLYQNSTSFGSTGGTSSTPRFLPWNSTPVGPSKNASYGTWTHPSRGTISGIWLDSWGTWEIDLQTMHSNTIVIGIAGIAVGIDVYDTVTGTLYSRKIAPSSLSSLGTALQVSHRVVITEGERYFVASPVWHSLSGGSLSFPGSDTYTTFAAKRIDIRTDGALNPTPIVEDV